jgi:hypothetical protein
LLTNSTTKIKVIFYGIIDELFIFVRKLQKALGLPIKYQRETSSSEIKICIFGRIDDELVIFVGKL